MLPKKTYTVKEVANLLGFSTNTVYKYLDDGKIKSTRLGKEGRFRIPKSEVERLLQENKDSIVIAEPVTNLNSVGSSEVRPIYDIQGYKNLSLFDWFLGFLSMGLGFSRLIFPVFSLNSNTSNFLSILGIFQILLFFEGVIYLFFNIIIIHRRWVRKLLYLALCISYLTIGVVLFVTGSISDASGYLAMSLVLIFNIFKRFSTFAKYVLYLNLILFIAGFFVVAWPEKFFVANFIPLKFVDLNTFFILWVCGQIVLLSLGFKSLKSGGVYMKILGFLAALFSLIYATFSFANGFWSRAIFCVIFSSFSFIFPFTDNFESFALKFNKKVMFGFFWLMGILFIGLSVLYFIYVSFDKYISYELSNRVNTASDILTNFMEGNENKIFSFAKNTEIMTNNEVIKQLYLSSNNTLRRLVLVNKEGKIVDTYPFNLSSQNVDISNRDYFNAVKNGQSVYVTGIVQPSSPGVPPALIVSAPILDKYGDFVGALLGSVDLTEMARRVNQVKFGENGKFVLVDNHKNYIIPEVPDKILTKAPDDSLVSLAVDGKSGVGKDYDENGYLTVVAYKKVEHLGWGLAARQPFSDVFRIYSVAAFIIFLVFMLSGVGSLIITVYFNKKLFNAKVY